MWPAGWAVRASSGAAAAPDAGPWLCLHGERSLCYWTLLITDGTGQITGNRLIKFHVLWDLWPNIAPLGMVNLGLEWLQEGHFYLQILLGRKLLLWFSCFVYFACVWVCFVGVCVFHRKWEPALRASSTFLGWSSAAGDLPTGARTFRLLRAVMWVARSLAHSHTCLLVWFKCEVVVLVECRYWSVLCQTVEFNSCDYSAAEN